MNLPRIGNAGHQNKLAGVLADQPTCVSMYQPVTCDARFEAALDVLILNSVCFTRETGLSEAQKMIVTSNSACGKLSHTAAGVRYCDPCCKSAVEPAVVPAR